MVVLQTRHSCRHILAGQLAFNDPDQDELVEPRVGRCVLFASGPHHLHQAKAQHNRAALNIIAAMQISMHSQHENNICLRIGLG